MNHPYEQLADLVDGTLDEETLAGVQAHLRTCASCREDLGERDGGPGGGSLAPPGAGPRRSPRTRGGGRRRPRSRGARLVPVGRRGRGRRPGARRIALALPDVGDETADM